LPPGQQSIAGSQTAAENLVGYLAVVTKRVAAGVRARKQRTRPGRWE